MDMKVIAQVIEKLEQQVNDLAIKYKIGNLCYYLLGVTEDTCPSECDLLNLVKTYAKMLYNIASKDVKVFQKFKNKEFLKVFGARKNAREFFVPFLVPGKIARNLRGTVRDSASITLPR